MIQEIRAHAKASFLGAVSMSIIWLLLISHGYFAFPLLPFSSLSIGVNSFLTALIMPSAVLMSLMGGLIAVNYIMGALTLFAQWLGFTSSSYSWPYGLRGAIDSAPIDPIVKAALHTEFTHELKEMKARVDALSHKLSREPTNDELLSRGFMRCFHLQRNQLDFFQLVCHQQEPSEQQTLIRERKTHFNRQLGVRYV